MGESPCTGQLINQFAVVSYIPETLGSFITELRRELVRDCQARSHISVLAPRPLQEVSKAREDFRVITQQFSPFRIELRDLQIFRETSVIFADIGMGRERFFEMHDALNAGALAFNEPFCYHPHITLAQNIDQGEVSRVYELAQRRWEDAPRSHVVIDKVTFVQNTNSNRWIDLIDKDLVELRPEPRVAATAEEIEDALTRIAESANL
jgi:2'-5' RNA ligase